VLDVNIVPGNRKVRVALIVLICAVLLVALSALFATAGYFGIRALGMIGHAASKTNGPTIRATNQTCKITVPIGWSSINQLNRDAVISAANLTVAEYFMVICDPKGEAASGIDQYADLVSNAMVNRLQAGAKEEPTHLQINGKPAIRFIINGSYDKMDFVYALTCVEGENHRYQLLGWTFKNRRPQAETHLARISESWVEETGL
jgi:hypothetical protein